MSTGIAFGRGNSWLVGAGLAEPIMRRVAETVGAADPGLAEQIMQGVYAQCVSVDLLDPDQREQVRRTVADVARELLADDALLDSIDETPRAAAVPDREANRRRTVERLLELAESDETRRFAAGRSD